MRLRCLTLILLVFVSPTSNGHILIKASLSSHRQSLMFPSLSEHLFPAAQPPWRRCCTTRRLERERRRSKERISRNDYYETHRVTRNVTEERREDHGIVRQEKQDDDITPYKSIQIKRTQSGRMIESHRGGSNNSIVHSRSDYKPRALSFRVSPAKHIATLEHQATQSDVSEALHDVHHKMQPIFHHNESTRDTNISISKHIQSKVSNTSHPSTAFAQPMVDTQQQRNSSVDPQYERPPPLPERPPRQTRHSEPALFPSMPTGELTSSGPSQRPDYYQVCLLGISHSRKYF